MAIVASLCLFLGPMNTGVDAVDMPIVIQTIPPAVATPVGNYAAFQVVVRDSAGLPWTGWLDWHTGFGSKNSVAGNVYIENGGGRFGYVGTTEGIDNIYVDRYDLDPASDEVVYSWLPRTGGQLGTPAYVTFDDFYYDSGLPTHNLHGFTAYDVLGHRVSGGAYTAVVTGANGPKTINGQLDGNGSAVFGYNAANAGIDELTVSVGPAVGMALRSYQLNTPADFCQATGPIPASNLPKVIPPSICDLTGRVISDAGLTITVPQPGGGIDGESYGSDGAQEFTVGVEPNGTVHLANVGDEVAAMEYAAASADSAGVLYDSTHPNPCRDDERNVVRHESDTQQWLFNPESVGGAGSGLSASEALDAIRAGRYNMGHAVNGCNEYWGNSDVGANSNYLGTTSARANIGNSGDCFPNGRDGVNITNFGDLPGNRQGHVTLAMSCRYYYYISNEVAEADIKFNKFDASWTVQPTTGCYGKWDLESVATHEVGHAFGLGHVAENGHGRLTMSPSIEGTCQDSERTLGRGDFLGIMEAS